MQSCGPDNSEHKTEANLTHLPLTCLFPSEESLCGEEQPCFGGVWLGYQLRLYPKSEEGFLRIHPLALS